MEEIFGIAGLSLIIADLSGVMKAIKIRLNIKRLKPFDCSFCLSWWLSVIYCIFCCPEIQKVLFITGVTPIVVLLIDKALNYEPRAVRDISPLQAPMGTVQKGPDHTKPKQGSKGRNGKGTHRTNKKNRKP